MSDDFYTMVDSGDPAPDNEHITGVREEHAEGEQTTTQAPKAMYAARIAVYDDMLSTPRVIVIDPQDVRTYLEETTNPVYQCMKEQGGHISLMVIPSSRFWTAETPSALLIKDPASTTRNALSTLALPAQTAR